jgi:hypothetical protein
MRVLILGGTLFIGRRIALLCRVSHSYPFGAEADPASAATQGPAGGSLISVNGGGSVNLPVSALSNGSGNGSAT